MPRPRTVPAYRLHRPSGRAVVTLHGKDHYLGVYGSAESHEAYRRLIAGWTPQSPPPEPGPGGLSVSRVVALYLERCAGPKYRHTDEAGQARPTPMLSRVRRALAPLTELYGPTPAADFGPRAFQAVRRAYLERGYCRKQCNALAQCVRRCFAWAVAEELIGAVQLHALGAVEALRPGEGVDHDAVRPVPEAHIPPVQDRVLPPVRDLIDFQLLTACRPGEAVRLRPQDLDRAGAVWFYRPARHKTARKGHTRTIFVGPRCQKLLAPYLARRRPGEYVFSPREAMLAYLRARGRKEVTTAKDRYTVSAYGRAVREACDALGLPRWRPHRLRHNAATRIVDQFGWEVGRIVLGHRHVSVTALYADDNTRKAAEAMARAG